MTEARVTKIVLHHAAAPKSTTVEDIKRWHLEKGWRDIGYHWLITDAPDSPVGPQMHIGRAHNLDDRWEPWERGAHAKGHNSHRAAERRRARPAARLARRVLLDAAPGP